MVRDSGQHHVQSIAQGKAEQDVLNGAAGNNSSEGRIRSSLYGLASHLEAVLWVLAKPILVALLQFLGSSAVAVEAEISPPRVWRDAVSGVPGLDGKGRPAVSDAGRSERFDGGVGGTDESAGEGG